MSKVGAIFRREFRSYFLSPTAYVIVTVYLLIGGFFFYTMLSYFSRLSLQFMQLGYTEGLLNVGDMVLRPLFVNMSLILLMIIPMITMRLIAEERHSGTAELLFTTPVAPWQIIAGKYLAALGIIGVITVLTGIYPAITLLVGDPDPGPIFTALVGLFLTGAGFVSVGLLASSASENQIVAAVVSFGLLLLLWVIGWAGSITEGRLSGFLEYLSVLSHYEEFAKGVVDTKHVVFFLSLAFFPLFLSRQMLTARHGR